MLQTGVRSREPNAFPSTVHNLGIFKGLHDSLFGLRFASTIVSDGNIQSLMKNAYSSNQISRREFLNQTTGGIAASAVVGPALLSCGASAAESLKQTIGIQVGSISFIDEGTEQALDLLQERGAVNTI